MNLEKIANLIKTKRKEKNLTQEELAKKLNVTEKAISRWETGRGTPDISLLIPLSNVLEVSISEILTGEENKKANENIKNIIKYINFSKKKKNNKLLVLSIIIYIITLFLYLAYLKAEYQPNISIPYISEIICNLFFALAIITANKIIVTYYFDKIENKEKMKKITFVILLILYSILIFNLTIFGRQVGEIRINLIPFKTIIEYFINFQKFNLNVIFINILGNIVIFMPIQYFIIKISNLKGLKRILPIDIFVILGIEFLQLITHTGVFDIDDIILNLFGMLIIYFILKIYKHLKSF